MPALIPANCTICDCVVVVRAPLPDSRVPDALCGECAENLRDALMEDAQRDTPAARV